MGELSERQITIQRKRFEVGRLSKWEDFQSGRTFRKADNNSKEEVRGGRALLRLAAYPQSRQELLRLNPDCRCGQHNRQTVNSKLQTSTEFFAVNHGV